ncbi:MAG: GlmU family protein [Flavobacteriales bacterium]|nr:GlmU family protein [Flavobacteriales bacterium]
MNVILFDDDSRGELLPLTYTRPTADLRVGVLTIREKWEKYLSTSSSSITENYLSNKYPAIVADDNMLINGSVFPNRELVDDILSMGSNEKLVHGNVTIAARLDREKLNTVLSDSVLISKLDVIKRSCEFQFDKLNHLWDLFQKNGSELEADFKLLSKNRKSATISKTNQVIGNHIFIEEGAKVECAILNSNTGPIYIGKDTEVMEGSIVRGPFALCNHSTLKLGTKIYGPTTIGPHSKVGGEVNNSVILGYSNKGHDGFMGNSIIGEWCNLGADTNTSNLKNNYGNVSVWNYPKRELVKTEHQFVGLIMADHSKCGINTMFNTGTVVGVCSNVFGADFPSKFIPSFSWGGANGFVDFKIEKAFELAESVMDRRGVKLTQEDREILKHIDTVSQNFK